jgi:hypothetical protein
MATGDIAYDALSAREHPGAVAAIVAIMRKAIPNARRVRAATGRAERQGARAAPVRPDGPLARRRARQSARSSRLALCAQGGLALALHACRSPRATLNQGLPRAVGGRPRSQGPARPARRRAVLGDAPRSATMHQPLHAGHWMSWTFPKTDRGGTIAYVRWAPGGPSVDLHEFWDSGFPIAPADARIGSEADRPPAPRWRTPGRPPGELGPDPPKALPRGWEARNPGLWVAGPRCRHAPGPARIAGRLSVGTPARSPSHAVPRGWPPPADAHGRACR